MRSRMFRLALVVTAAAFVVTVLCTDTSEAKKRSRKDRAQTRKKRESDTTERRQNPMMAFLSSLPAEKRKEVMVIQKDVNAQIQEIRRKGDERIRKVLTDEQRQKFDEIQKQMEAQRKSQRDARAKGKGRREKPE